ncbi:MAG: gluconolactonase [Microbacteriaceae bacterium]|nr:gluconolactonase [Microbacteriaceae bacterium]
MNTTVTTSFAGPLVERVATGFAFTEGPVWDNRTSSLIFSDIPNSRIHRWDGREVTTYRSATNKANGLAIDLSGRLLVCEHATSRVTATAPDGSIVTIASTYAGRPLNSPNDIVQRADGTIYFTDPPYGRNNSFVGVKRPQDLAFQGVYLVREAADEPELLSDDFVAPNGLCFSPDESRLYVNDSEQRHIRRFDVAANGTLTGGGVFFSQTGDFERGVPDGMKVDSLGNVLCSGPGGIWRISEEGELIEVLDVPEVVANFCFGGAQRDWLYITASTSVYRVPVAVPGIIPAS